MFGNSAPEFIPTHVISPANVYNIKNIEQVKPTLTPLVFTRLFNMPIRNTALIGPINNPLAMFEKFTISIFTYVDKTAKHVMIIPNTKVIILDL